MASVCNQLLKMTRNEVLQILYRQSQFTKSNMDKILAIITVVSLKTSSQKQPFQHFKVYVEVIPNDNSQVPTTIN